MTTSSLSEGTWRDNHKDDGRKISIKKCVLSNFIAFIWPLSFCQMSANVSAVEFFNAVFIF